MPSRNRLYPPRAGRRGRRRVVRALALRGATFDAKQIYRYTQNYARTTFSQLAVTATGFGMYFTLAGINQVATFQALYDQYRIVKIDVTIRPMFESNSLTQVGNIIPLLYSAVDEDDASNPSGIAVMSEYSRVRITKGTAKHTFTPHVAFATYSGAFTSYGTKSNQWIDCASSGVEHYGLKMACTPGGAGQTQLQTWEITARLYLEFKNVH